MRVKYKVLSLLITFVLSSAIFAGCNAPGVVTTGEMEPISVVSVSGPMSPINPGGPNVEIVLKNASGAPVASLTASLNLGRSYEYIFPVSPSQPLVPGGTTSLTKSLIGAGISSEKVYTLSISGTYTSRGSFNFTTQAKITQP